MANASGPAGFAEPRKPPPGTFVHKASQTIYTVGDALCYKKQTLVEGQKVTGSKTLRYFVGSGTHARGYIFLERGKFFQAPIAYYAARQQWDMAPGFETGTHIFLGRQIEPGCLNCHASGVQLDREVPFDEGAVACERCHGPGSLHVKTANSGKSAAAVIVNPAKLEPLQRDSVCAQCHLTGDARITKPGRSETTFRPGNRLTDHVVPFIRSTPDRAELKVVGHFEGLWLSRCKREAGDKLWCGTCHDPHTVVSRDQKAVYYREKCFTCHNDRSCKLALHARMAKSDDCTACHMASRATVDGLHTAFTDHSISRIPAADAISVHTGTSIPSERRTSADLKPFWVDTATTRDLALAYGDVAWRTHAEWDYQRAFTQLQTALRDAPGDAELLAELGYIYDLTGNLARATECYTRALSEAPNNLTALSNLALQKASAGQSDEARQLWRSAFSLDPGLAAPGSNLARLLLNQGKVTEAREILNQVLSLNPDSQTALALRNLLGQASSVRPY